MLQRTVPSVTPDSTGIEIAAAVLEDLKDPKRWCQHQLQDGTGRYCLLGSAMHVAGMNPSWHYPSAEFLKKRVLTGKLADALGFRDSNEVAFFNNISTHSQVVQRLKDAVGAA